MLKPNAFSSPCPTKSTLAVACPENTLLLVTSTLRPTSFGRRSLGKTKGELVSLVGSAQYSSVKSKANSQVFDYEKVRSMGDGAAPTGKAPSPRPFLKWPATAESHFQQVFEDDIRSRAWELMGQSGNHRVNNQQQEKHAQPKEEIAE